MEQVLGVTVELREGRLAARLALPAALPIERLVIGRPAEEVAALMPRLFALCGTAQGAAVRLALGLPLPEGTDDGLRREALRDHLAKLWLAWPALLGQAPRPLPPLDAAAALGRALLGPGALPETWEGFARWLAAGEGTAPVLAAIDRAFAPGEAEARLAPVADDDAMTPSACENSVAARQAGHPLMQAVAAARGTGPLWQATARLIEAQALAHGPAPAPRRLADGTALAPAARGLYAVAASARDGSVTAFARRTPTDHLTAPGGALERAVATLPAAKAALAPLVVDILAPCVATRVEVPADA